MDRDSIIDFINNTLRVTEGKDPWVFNGLQVVGKDNVKKIYLGVSPNLELFNKAAESRADMIILHHGMFGPRFSNPITTLFKNRLKVLFEHDITLLSYHLYLDNHPELGNNAQLIKLLGAQIGPEFGFQDGTPWGFTGKFNKGIAINEFIKRINVLCPQAKNYGQGPKEIKTFGVVSGGGAYDIKEAIEKNLDAFISGEVVEPLPAMAKEAGIWGFSLGHYNSEKFGIMALGEVLKKKFPSLLINFIDVPNPL